MSTQAWRRARFVVVLASVLTLMLLSPAHVLAGSWGVETLDGQGGADGRIDSNVGQTSATLLYGEKSHVWYHDSLNRDLRHAWWNGTTWRFETLDGRGGPDGRLDADVGANPVASLYKDRPHVWYFDASNGDLRHGWWNGKKWRFETLDGQGGADGRIDAIVGSSGLFGSYAAILFNDLPHVWYYDASNGDLRHGWWNGKKWRFETLDGAAGPDGRFDGHVAFDGATAMLYGKGPHVWYNVDRPSGDLRHGWWNGKKWRFETLDGAAGPDGRVEADAVFSAASTRYQGRPHVWYGMHNAGGQVWSDVLRHAWWNGEKWRFETLDGAGGPNGATTQPVGDTPAAVGFAGRPHVFYSSANGPKRHAWWNGSTWKFADLDASGYGGTSASTPPGQVDVFFWNPADGDLRRANYS